MYYALLLIFAFYIFSFLIYEQRVIPSESMVPNLQVGDRVAVNKFAYGYSRYSLPWGAWRLLPEGDGRVFGGKPERGDVAVFMHPHTDRVMIKRIIGLPGDQVQMIDEHGGAAAAKVVVVIPSTPRGSSSSSLLVECNNTSAIII